MLRRRGYDLEKAAEIYQVKRREVFTKGCRQGGNARSLFCFGSVRELGNSLNALAKRSEMSPAGLSNAAQRGEAITQTNNYLLTR